MKKIIVIRHAHKDSDELTEKGISRCKTVAQNMEKIHLVIVSERNRTMQTAQILTDTEVRVDSRANPPKWGTDSIDRIRESQKTHRLGAVAAIWEDEKCVKLAKEASGRLLELIKEIFTQIGDGEQALIVSHDGTIVGLEKLLNDENFDIRPDHAFSELSGLVVTEDLTATLFNQ